MKQYFYVGTYTEPILFGTGQIVNGHGKGIYLCEFEDGHIKVLEYTECRNPSFLYIDELKKKIYTVNEMKEYNGDFGGGITQISYEGEKCVIERDMCTGGTDPCHIVLSPNRKFIAVSNFANGSVSIFPLDEEGNIIGRQVFEHEGSSIHPLRQRGPHAHAAIFLGSENLMYIADLGIDMVKAYKYDGDTVVPAPEYDCSVPPGSGPRSGVFSDDEKFFYLIHELGSQVSYFSNDHGKLTYLGLVETLPEDFDKSKNICSDLHITPDKKFLYASNRGHDSISCYKIEADGSLTFLHRTPCGGQTPRNFAIDPSGKYILVGNQDSDTITTFSIEEDGSLTYIDSVDIPMPVCILFFNR